MNPPQSLLLITARGMLEIMAGGTLAGDETRTFCRSRSSCAGAGASPNGAPKPSCSLAGTPASTASERGQGAHGTCI